MPLGLVINHVPAQRQTSRVGNVASDLLHSRDNLRILFRPPHRPRIDPLNIGWPKQARSAVFFTDFEPRTVARERDNLHSDHRGGFFDRVQRDLDWHGHVLKSIA